MVPLVRIGLTTPSLPRKCSTTEPQRHKRENSDGLAQTGALLFLRKRARSIPLPQRHKTKVFYITFKQKSRKIKCSLKLFIFKRQNTLFLFIPIAFFDGFAFIRMCFPLRQGQFDFGQSARIKIQFQRN